MKDKLFIAGLILYAVGFFVVCQFSNWQTCLGVIILMWANNIEQRYRKETSSLNSFNVLFKPNDNSQHDRQRL
jgi:hypothetical protein